MHDLARFNLRVGRYRGVPTYWTDELQFSLVAVT